MAASTKTRGKQIAPPKKDPEKEGAIKQLAEQLADFGYTVRRERLKQGHGWKVVSGSCRLRDDRYIFVDPRLTQDEQILFLQGRIAELKPESPNRIAVDPGSSASVAE